MMHQSSSSRGRDRSGCVPRQHHCILICCRQVDEAKGNLKPFTFNVVFEPEATQEDVLEHSGMKK